MNITKHITRIAAIPTVSVALFAGALVAHAGETFVSKVPFEFTIADKTLPAGEYRFEIDRVPNTVYVRSADASTTATALSRRAAMTVSESVPSLKFNVYGGQRFLSRIQTNNSTAVTLAQCSQERALAKTQGVSSDALVSASVLQKTSD